MATLELIVLLLVVILAPGIPAFLLYSKLPAKTIVTGPFQGFQVHLTGAFGGYFLVLLIAAGFAAKFYSDQQQDRRDADEYETWMVRGQLVAAPGGPKLDSGQAQITVSPPVSKTEKDNSFWTVIPLQRGRLGSATVMQIDKPPFDPAVIHLRKGSPIQKFGSHYELEWDTAGRTIIIKTPVVLAVPPSKYGETPAFDPTLGGLESNP